jgi:hypothetical protein
MAATPRATRLFTLRMWQEEADGEQAEWRGKVQALPEGEAYYFRDWSGLIAHLQAMLDAGRAEQPDPEL